MAGIIEQIGSLAGTELAKAINLAHETYLERMGEHGHTGRALVETVAEVARNHPNLVGVGVGLIVEQLLAEEKRRHDAYLAGVDPESRDADIKIARSKGKKSPEHGEQPHAPPPALPSHHNLLPTQGLRLSAQKPGRVALEVFGGILLLKLASFGARMFRHKRQGEVWFAPAARIRLFSGTIAAYYLAKSIRSPKLSAWRNAAVALFATDAMKPVLRVPKKRKGGPASTKTPPLALAPAAPSLASPALDPFETPESEQTRYSPSALGGADQVQSVGSPKRDPRPMPVWPSEAKKTALPPAPTPEPVAVSQPQSPAPEPAPVEAVPAPPPVEAHEGPFPPG